MDKKKLIVFKGFDKDLKCKGEQFEIGKTYFKDTQKKLRLCSNTGWHFSKELKDIFTWYKNNGKNRFCEIEILGDYLYSENYKKGITDNFRIIREIYPNELREINKEQLLKLFQLDFLNKLQEKYPIIIGGSLALILYGCNIKRNINNNSDMDIIMPYYIKITQEEFNKYIIGINYNDNYKSGCDFDSSIDVLFRNNNRWQTMDFRIDPKQKYNIIKYKDYSFNVIPLEEIIAAKISYGGEKHINDLYNMLDIDRDLIF